MLCMPNPLRPLPSLRFLRPIGINPHRPFHNTHHLRASHSHLQHSQNQDHYEILGVSHGASAGDIKRQFYTLSKLHHPDRNPTDPTASSRFLAISEAYHVLSSPEKRAQYDRSFRPAVPSHPNAHRGSFSSASRAGPAGGRPASGLSRRRGQFRGPPPSFYRNGAYGAHGAKRTAAQAGESAGPNSSSEASSSGGGAAGMGPGATHPSDYAEPSIPHWDRAGHFRTHEEIRQRAASRTESDRRRVEEEMRGNANMALQFVVVSGILLLSVVVGIHSSYAAKTTGKKRGRYDEG